MTAGNNLNTPKTNALELIVRWFLPSFWAAVILWLSLTPSPPQLPGLLGWDKLLHAGAYGLLSVLIAQILFHVINHLDKACWYAGLAALCYGTLLEVLQLLTQTGRTAEWLDLFADAVGILLCCVIFRHAFGLVCQSDEHSDANHG